MSETPSGEINQEADGVEQYEKYEKKIDELWEGLLTAYCAGFAKGAETFGGPNLDVEGLKSNDFLSVSHYYYWDGKALPLEFWLREQFGVETATRGDR